MSKGKVKDLNPTTTPQEEPKFNFLEEKVEYTVPEVITIAYNKVSSKVPFSEADQVILNLLTQIEMLSQRMQTFQKAQEKAINLYESKIELLELKLDKKGI